MAGLYEINPVKLLACRAQDKRWELVSRCNLLAEVETVVDTV